MARLYRPAIPVHVKCRVVLRQLGEMFIDDTIELYRKNRNLGWLLEVSLAKYAALLKCEVVDLRLDHDPALGLRQRTGEGKRTVYKPDANDPAALAYRPHGAQFAGSHDVKTRIRGDHGQYSDIVLMKRERRREKKAAAAKMRNKLPKFKARRKAIRCRWKWPKRKLQKRRKP